MAIVSRRILEIVLPWRRVPLDVPVQTVLGSWMAKYGDAPVLIPPVTLESGTADWLTARMLTVIGRWATFNSNTRQHEINGPELQVLAQYDIHTSGLSVLVREAARKKNGNR